MRSAHFIIPLTALFLYACIKDKDPIIEQPKLVNTEIKNGLPDDPQKIHGHFYACLSAVNWVFSYASFRDPSGNLTSNLDRYADRDILSGNPTSVGNVQVGRISFSGKQLTLNNSGFSMAYTGSTEYIPDKTTRWTAEGNGQFKPIDITVPRGFPEMVYAFNSIIKRSEGLTVDPEFIAKNYDSLIISIISSGRVIQKRAVSGDKSITFTPSDLAILSIGPDNLHYYAFNYSTKIVDSKEYMFELSNKFKAAVEIKN